MKIVIIADDNTTILGQRAIEPRELKAIKGTTANPKELFLSLINDRIRQAINQLSEEKIRKDIVEAIGDKATYESALIAIENLDYEKRLALVDADNEIPDLTQE
jgi:hypothetical protein